MSKNTIKILKGTIVKCDGQPIKLTKSINVSLKDNELELIHYDIILDEDFKKLNREDK